MVMYDELIKSLREDHGKQYFARDMEAANAIEKLQKQRKTGQWIKATDELGETWMCSECCEEYVVSESDMDEFPQWAHYCPNCGTELEP